MLKHTIQIWKKALVFDHTLYQLQLNKLDLITIPVYTNTKLFYLYTILVIYILVYAYPWCFQG